MWKIRLNVKFFIDVLYNHLYHLVASICTQQFLISLISDICQIKKIWFWLFEIQTEFPQNVRTGLVHGKMKRIFQVLFTESLNFSLMVWFIIKKYLNFMHVTILEKSTFVCERYVCRFCSHAEQWQHGICINDIFKRCRLNGKASF